MTRSVAQQERQIAMSRAGGKATAEKNRSHRLFVGHHVFITEIISKFTEHQQEPLRGCNIDVAIDAFVKALSPTTNLKTQWNRKRRVRLYKFVNRSALEALRALGGTWDQVFDLLVSEDDRIQEEQKR